MSAPQRIGLPYGSYPRLLLAWLTSEAVRTRNPEIRLGAIPNDLVRKLGLSTISGPRGTAQSLENQLRRLNSTRLEWKTSLGLHPTIPRSAYVTLDCPFLVRAVRGLMPGRLAWRSEIVLSQDFFEEVTRSAVPIDLRALRILKTSPLAIDLYTWLTYRMSYLRKPTVIPWEGLQGQFGADYSRPRDFRRRALNHLEAVVSAYPTVRVSQADAGLRLYPSPPHVQARKGPGRGMLPMVSGPSQQLRHSRKDCTG